MTWCQENNIGPALREERWHTFLSATLAIIDVYELMHVKVSGFDSALL